MGGVVDYAANHLDQVALAVGAAILITACVVATAGLCAGIIGGALLGAGMSAATWGIGCASGGSCDLGELAYQMTEGAVIGGLTSFAGAGLGAAKAAWKGSSIATKLGARLGGRAANNAGSALGRVRALGKAGEDASGLVKNSRRIDSLTGTAKYRIPDGLTRTVISETKNVGRLSYTRQLRDDVAWATQSGLRFDLYVRRTTELSGPLEDAIRRGLINRRYLPW